jgi:Integrase core domain
VWLNEYATLDDARRGIGGYVDRYHHRPHSSLNYRTPVEVRQTCEDQPKLQKQAAYPVNTGGEQVTSHPQRSRATTIACASVLWPER